MRKFEFHSFAADEHGAIASQAEVTTALFSETAQAKAHGGKLAKQCRGPVDILHAHDLSEQADRDWNSRYITTASPSEHHAQGYRLGRLD